MLTSGSWKRLGAVLREDLVDAASGLPGERVAPARLPLLEVSPVDELGVPALPAVLQGVVAVEELPPQKMPCTREQIEKHLEDIRRYQDDLERLQDGPEQYRSKEKEDSLARSE